MAGTTSKGMLTLILADSEIEIVPKEFWSHPAVVLNAKKRKKKPSQVLLDSTLHYSIFKDPEDRKRRGRPDIVHQFLLLGLDSILNRTGDLRLLVHTRNNKVISIEPNTRLPKNYNRYYGLFEELFKSGKVPSGKEPLIQLEENISLSALINRQKNDHGEKTNKVSVVLFHPEGELKDTLDLFKGLSSEGNDHIICIIGGFSSGDFRSPVKEISDKEISLPGGELKVWTVVSEILVGYRQA